MTVTEGDYTVRISSDEPIERAYLLLNVVKEAAERRRLAANYKKTHNWNIFSNGVSMCFDCGRTDLDIHANRRVCDGKNACAETGE